MSSSASQSTAESREVYIPSHGRGHLRPFVKGKSGNPGGIGGKYRETQQLARDASPEVMRTLIAIAKDEREDSRVRVVAANAVLDRAFGKPKEHTAEDQEKMVVNLDNLSEDERALLAKLMGKVVPKDAP